MEFPVDAVIPRLSEALTLGFSAILVAEPGAGKTTRVPLKLLGSSWLGDKKIIMLEPRRLAARAAAVTVSRAGANPPWVHELQT